MPEQPDNPADAQDAARPQTPAEPSDGVRAFLEGGWHRGSGPSDAHNADRAMREMERREREARRRKGRKR